MHPARNFERPIKGCGDREGAKEYSGSGGARVDHRRRRIDLDSFFIVV